MVVPLVVGLVLVSGCKKNHAPDAPAFPTGPSLARPDSSYSCSSSAEDPDGDSVAIRFDWGDGDTSVWSAFVASGDTVAMSHVWSLLGTFYVSAQAKDKDGAASIWSSGRAVLVTRTWVKTFGGIGDDWGRSVQLTHDGGYIVTGSTWSYGAGHDDVWLLMVGADGDMTWSKTFGGLYYDGGISVQPTQDGGYVVTGYTDSYGAGGDDVWLVKTDAEGDTVWTRTFGGAGGDVGVSVQPTREGGYITTGHTDSYGAGGDDVWLIKTDANGDTVWTRTFGGIGRDCGNSVQQTADGGYIVTGYTDSYGVGGSDVWLIKTDASGDTEWTRTFGGTEMDVGNSVQQTGDGGCIVTGVVDDDAWLIKTDANGGTLWSKTFGGIGYDGANSVRETRDGGYIIAGYTMSYGAGSGDGWLIKTDARGDTVWTRTFGGTDEDYMYTVEPARDGGYVIAGLTISHGTGDYDVWLVKTDAEGRVYHGGGK